MSQPTDISQQARAIRALAQRARRLAQSLSADADRDRLIRHAEELERQALELEQDGAPSMVVQKQVQMQVQQQQETGLSVTTPEEPKPKR